MHGSTRRNRPRTNYTDYIQKSTGLKNQRTRGERPGVNLLWWCYYRRINMMMMMWSCVLIHHNHPRKPPFLPMMLQDTWSTVGMPSYKFKKIALSFSAVRKNWFSRSRQCRKTNAFPLVKHIWRLCVESICTFHEDMREKRFLHFVPSDFYLWPFVLKICSLSHSLPHGHVFTRFSTNFWL